MLLLATLAAALCLLAGPALGADPAVTADGVALQVDSARWESGYGERFFQVVGTAKNVSQKPVGAVRIRTELLDAGGKVVATFDGWNGRAEALADLAGDAARAVLVARSVAPIDAGASDRFRATFLADETPAFASQRVRVLDVLPAP